MLSKIYIYRSAQERLFKIAKLALPNEIGGLAKINRIKGLPVITEIALLEQTTNGVNTTLDDEAIYNFIMSKGRLNPGETWSCWWHSHANFPVFWSGEDNGTIDGFTNNWNVSVVVNAKEEVKCRVDYYYPIRTTVDVEVEIINDIQDEIDIAVKSSFPTPLQLQEKHWATKEMEIIDCEVEDERN